MPVSQEEPAGSFFVGERASEEATWVAHCDGGAWPNPGTMAIGVVLVSTEGLAHTVSKRLATCGCNNEAEWQAAVVALDCAWSRGARVLHLHTDSTQIRDHLQSLAAKPLPDALQGWVLEARMRVAQFKHVRVTWVPRHRNAQADALARAALGLPPKLTLVPHPRARRHTR